MKKYVHKNVPVQKYRGRIDSPAINFTGSGLAIVVGLDLESGAVFLYSKTKIGIRAPISGDRPEEIVMPIVGTASTFSVRTMVCDLGIKPGIVSLDEKVINEDGLTLFGRMPA
jgi:hypothetical protein